MSVKERLIEYIEYKQITKSAFCDTIGVSKAFISSMRQSIQPDKIKSIALNFEDLNTGWLLTGEGEMLKTKNTLSEDLVSYVKSSGVPYFEDLDVTASVVTSFKDYTDVPTFKIDYKHFNDCDAYLPVLGDSMNPKYCSGDIIAVKQLQSLETILWGETYLVITNDNANSLRTIKDVHYCKDESKIILRSYNPEYQGDTYVRKEDIISMFIIKGRIRRNQL